MPVNRVDYFGETLIDISDSTLTEENLGEGEIGYNKAGERVMGTAKIQKRVYINNDQENVSVPVATFKEFSAEITENGVYAVCASFEWGVSNDKLIGYADLLDDSLQLSLSISRNSLNGGGGHALFAVSEFHENGVVKLRMQWNGGSGSILAKRIRFRIAKISE